MKKKWGPTTRANPCARRFQWAAAVEADKRHHPLRKICGARAERGRAVQSHSCASKSTNLRKKSFDWIFSPPSLRLVWQSTLRACDVDANGSPQHATASSTTKCCCRAVVHATRDWQHRFQKTPTFFSRGLTADRKLPCFMQTLNYRRPPWLELK